MNYEQIWVIQKPKSAFANAGQYVDENYQDYLDGRDSQLEKGLGQSIDMLKLNGWRFSNQEDVNFQFLERTDLLVIDDEYQTIANICRQSKKNGQIKRIIIVDDPSVLIWLLKQKIESPRIITLDFKLKDTDTEEFKITQTLYSEIKKRWKNSCVIGLTQTESQPNAKILEGKIRSNGESVYDKGKFMNVLSDIFRDRLQILNLQTALVEEKEKNAVLTEKVAKLEKTLPETSKKHYLVGSSPKMRQVWGQLEHIKNDTKRKVVVIEGAVGTGKSTVAKAVCEDINVRNVKDSDCTRLNDKTLFGDDVKEGLIKKDSKDAVILNKFEFLSHLLQEQLADVLKQGCFYPVGSDESRACPQLSFIFTTNQSIEQLRREKKLTESLYAQISHNVIELPCFEERKDDIEDLIEFFRDKTELLGLSKDLCLKNFSVDPSVEKHLRLATFNENISSLRDYLKIIFEIAGKEGIENRQSKISIEARHVKSALPNLLSDYKNSENEETEVLNHLEEIEKNALLALDRFGLTAENLKQKHLEEVTNEKNYRQNRINNWFKVGKREKIGRTLFLNNSKLWPTIRHIKPFREWI